MKRTNHSFVVARLMLLVLTLAIAVFSLASCEGLPPEIQGLLGGNPNANCEHEYDNACDFNCNKCGAVLIGFPEHYYDNDCDTDCNECGATREIDHVYDNDCDTNCNICGATRTIEPDNTRYTITEEEWNAALKLRNFTYVQAAPSSSVEYKVTETAIHLSSGSVNRYVILKDGITYYSEDGVNWKVSGDNFDSLTEHYVIEDMIGHAGVTFTKFLEVYEYSEESKAYVRTLANGGTAEFRFADGKLISFIANGQTPIQVTNVGTTVVEYSAFNIVDEIKPTCQHANVENCVCKDCGVSVHTDIECVPAMAPSCNDMGIRFDVYVCKDCGKGYSDEALKNEIADLNDVIIPALGHNVVGNVCERCGHTYDENTTSNPNVPKNPFLIRYKFEPSQEIEQGDEITAYASVKLIDEDGNVVATAITDEYGYGSFEVSISAGIYTLEVETGTLTCSGKTVTVQSVTITYDGSEIVEDVSLNYIVE